MAKHTLARFHLYRYQLLPVDRYFQGDLLGVKSVEELIAKKNELFAAALRTPRSFTSARSDTATQRLIESGDFFLYRIASNRSLQHETREFTTEFIDNWPKVLVVIWNHPDRQLVAIQHRAAAFQDTEAVMRLIFDSVEPTLAKHQLTVDWEPLFEKRVFWDLVEKHKGKIHEIDFELITPNMANISGVLPENLRQFAKCTNAVKSRVAITSDPSASLKVEPNDDVMKALVEYSSEGGGDIAIRLIGMKKKIHTSRSVREISIDETRIRGTPEQIEAALRELLS